MIKKLLSWTLTWKFIHIFTYLYDYVKTYMYISDTLYSDGFRTVIRKYLNMDIDRDWIGRLYGVLNPNIDINGNFNFNNVIIEIDGDNTNNNDYVQTWVYKQMRLIGHLFRIERLYDYISIDFRHVGPENQDNYLVVFDMVARKAFAQNFKSFMKQLILYAMVAAVALAAATYIY